MALVPCPECNHQVSEHAAACPQCGYKLNILMAQLIKVGKKQGIDITNHTHPNFGNTKMTFRSSIFTVLGILIVAFIGAGIFAGAEKKGTQKEVNDQKTTAAMPGDTAILKMSEGMDVPVAGSKEALDRLTTLSIARDHEGINQLLLAGYVWTVKSGTKCRVIDIGFLVYEVRILDGERSGSTCFVDRSFIVRK